MNPIIFPIFFGILYCFNNLGHRDPPIWDILSPLTTLSMIALGVPKIVYSVLFVQALADYIIGSNFVSSVVLFAFSHYIKQTIILNCLDEYYILSDDELLVFGLVHFITTCLVIFIVIVMIRSFWVINAKVERVIMGLYAVILVLTYIHMSMFLETMANGMLLFIVSDILILTIDMLSKTTLVLFIPVYRYKQMRVLLVPILYWVSQYITMRDFIDAC